MLSPVKLAILSLCFRTLTLATAAERPIDEYKVKAAFLYNFARFTEWPPEAFQKSEGNFVICVLGDNPFGSGLEETVAGKKIDGRPFEVRHISAVQRSAGCQILFVSSSEPKRIVAILNSINEPGMLTIGEADAAMSEGIMIHLRCVGGRVRFEINIESAERAKLRFSSRLLSLANQKK